MAQITKEEVEKIARLSYIELTEQEIITVTKHLEDVLSYAVRVQDIAKDINIPTLKNSNIERDDLVIPTDPQTILAQAPEREDDFFVVPAIIESN
jgi:aspartyl-tRNA(Asn)/glutamyl-tRNA(Gln) amidotransferase subunit C